MIDKFKKFVTEHNGITFTKYQGVEKRRGETATQEAKYHLEGVPSVTKAIGQYKYGDEVIIQIFNEAGSTIKRERVNSNYDRIQIFFKLDVFEEICKAFLLDLDDPFGA